MLFKQANKVGGLKFQVQRYRRVLGLTTDFISIFALISSGVHQSSVLRGSVLSESGVSSSSS